MVERIISLNDDQINYENKVVEFNGITYEDAALSNSSQVKAEFYKIAGLDSVPKELQITYPRTKDQKNAEVMDKGYEWFGNNHSGLEKCRTKAQIYEALPHILDKDITLPYNEKRQSYNGGKNNSGGRNNYGGYGGHQKPRNHGYNFRKS